MSDEHSRLEILRNILKDSPSLNTLGLPVQLVMGAEAADDCAVYDLPGNLSLVIGMDFVRGTGFVLFQAGHLNYFDVGYYLIVANLSDIAAMGATPIGLTTAIRYTETLTDDHFAQLLTGMKAAADFYETPIVGGDIGGYNEMVLAATALGITERGRYLTRRSTVPGDILCTTGYLGLASTAIVYFNKAKKAGLHLSSVEETLLLNAWKRPTAQVKTGKLLAEAGCIHACQDVSDGAKATIEQLSSASGVSFEIHAAHLPIHPITTAVAQFLAIDPIALAFSASVDFQLLFTVSSSDLEQVRRMFHTHSLPLFMLGYALPGTEPIRLKRPDGSISVLPGQVWKQQTQDITSVILASSDT